MRVGYFLSCEEYAPEQLVEQAVAAEGAGFDALWISDHFHPWNNEQGESPFVWSVIGAISQACSLPVTTAVTCPTVRTHPAVIAQAAATCARMLDGKFILGVGTGRGAQRAHPRHPWPSLDVRLEMLEEAVDADARALDRGGGHRQGKHYQVDTARIYTLPDQPPPIYMSAFGPKALEVAARIADGFICTQDDADMVSSFKEKSGGKPAQGGVQGGLGADRGRRRGPRAPAVAQRRAARRAGTGAASPQHFEQASELVTRESTADSVVAGDNVAEHVEQMRSSCPQATTRSTSPTWARTPGDDRGLRREVLPAVR